MAQFEFNGAADLINQLNKLSNYDEIAPRILREATPVLKKHVGDAYSKKISSEVGNSVDLIILDKNKYGWYSMVAPVGDNDSGHWTYTNKRGTEKQLKSAKRIPLTNIALAAFFEYGTSTMRARPILRNTVNNANDEVVAKLQESYNKVVNGE